MSVNTEEEAKQLLTRACHKSYEGEFLARELQEEQNFENLEAFGNRLAESYKEMLRSRAESPSFVDSLKERWPHAHVPYQALKKLATRLGKEDWWDLTVGDIKKSMPIVCWEGIGVVTNNRAEEIINEASKELYTIG